MLDSHSREENVKLAGVFDFYLRWKAAPRLTPASRVGTCTHHFQSRRSPKVKDPYPRSGKLVT